jgi:hypothetical protein
MKQTSISLKIDLWGCTTTVESVRQKGVINLGSLMRIGKKNIYKNKNEVKMTLYSNLPVELGH